jgi:hypothetical protein
MTGFADNAYPVALARKGLAKPFLGKAVGYAVNLGGIEKVDPRLQGSLDNREGGILVYLAPVITDVPGTQPDSRRFNSGVSKLPIDHVALLFAIPPSS